MFNLCYVNYYVDIYFWIDDILLFRYLISLYCSSSYFLCFSYYFTPYGFSYLYGVKSNYNLTLDIVVLNELLSNFLLFRKLLLSVLILLYCSLTWLFINFLLSYTWVKCYFNMVTSFTNLLFWLFIML